MFHNNKRCNSSKDTTIIDVYVPNNTAPRYVKLKWTKFKGEIDNHESKKKSHGKFKRFITE